MTRFFLRALATLLSAIVLASVGIAQKKPLTHEVYDGWKAVSSVALSNDGKWLVYTLSPQEGDNVVEAKSIDGSKSYAFDRGTGVRVSEDSKFVVATVVPKREEALKATRDKVKAEDRPKNGLLILNLATGEKTELERITSFSLAKYDAGWIVYKPEPAKPEPVKPQEKTAEGQEAPKKEEEPKKKKGHEDGQTIVARNLASGEEIKFENVGAYVTDEKGTKLYFARTPKGVEGHGVFAFEFETKAERPVMQGLAQYTKFALSEDGLRLAVLTDKDDYATEKASFSVYWAETTTMNTARAAHEGDKGIPEGWYLPSSATIRWNKAGDRLIFSTVVKPPKEEKKDTTPEDEKVSVDVWNWKDVELQPQQLLRAEQERTRTYEAVYEVSGGAIVQFETEEHDTVALPRDGNGRWGLSTIDQSSGAGEVPSDVFLVDMQSGRAKQVAKGLRGSLAFSPTGRWLVGFDYDAHESFVIEPGSGRRTVINDRFPHPLYDVKDDRPFGAGPYGTAGWSEDDGTVFVYDEFDVWSLDLTGTDKAVCVTGGYGRNWGATVRYLRVDPEQEFIDADRPAYFSLFETRSKRSGFAVSTMGASSYPTTLVIAPKTFSGLVRARDAEVYAYRREDVNEYRDVYVGDARLLGAQRMTDAAPQTKEYVWPTVQLIEWTSLDGARLQGLLYTPEDMDYSRKYPMVTHFYETSSDGMHRYLTPSPSASTVNIAWFVSNGYCVFEPDIPYKVGYPGESAVSAIVSGVNKVLEMGFVDPKRLGIQGQSWGGYQVAYLVTETDMFAAAGAGAPVSNMFSAYGGIRWGTGLVRQLQYEQGQSRIGGTPWEFPLRYLENSPVFFADKVKTPLLIMHNDKDGSVPWWQGIEMFTALWRLEKPVWMLVYNGEDHNLVQRKNRKDLSVRLEQFFGHYLKGEPMPVWMSEGVPASKKGTTMGFEPAKSKSGGE